MFCEWVLGVQMFLAFLCVCYGPFGSLVKSGTLLKLFVNAQNIKIKKETNYVEIQLLK